MPRLKFHGADEEFLLSKSSEIINFISTELKCPRDWILIEALPTKYIFDGKFIQGKVFIEFFWFDRGQEVQDKIATFLSNIFINAKIECPEIVFIELQRKNYYEDGVHY